MPSSGVRSDAIRRPLRWHLAHDVLDLTAPPSGMRLGTQPDGRPSPPCRRPMDDTGPPLDCGIAQGVRSDGRAHRLIAPSPCEGQDVEDDTDIAAGPLETSARSGDVRQVRARYRVAGTDGRARPHRDACFM